MKFNIFILFLSLDANISYASEKFPFTTQHYELSLSFDFNKETLPGLCEIEIINQSNQKAEELSLILYMLMKMDSVYNHYYTSGASTKDFNNYWMKLASIQALESFSQDWMYSTNYTTFLIEGMSLDEMVEYYREKQLVFVRKLHFLKKGCFKKLLHKSKIRDISSLKM